jgi:hypothetical protein
VKVKKLERYKLGHKMHFKRCERTSKKTHSFSYDNDTKGCQCSREAAYSVNEVGLCKQHAGEYLLLDSLNELNEE